MGKGKLADQVAHAAVLAALDAQGSTAFHVWSAEGQPKVVLKVADESQLFGVAATAERAGVPVHFVHDAGRTQVPSGTVTCCALGPADMREVDAVAGHLSLL